MRNASPLRYPGGKWRLATNFAALLATNFSKPPEYIEPFSGGASLAFSLLFDGHVSSLWLNDLDPAVYACLASIVQDCERFCEKVANVPVTIAERQCQKEIYRQGLRLGRFTLGFAAFYLNRTNHSGILNGGAIGGARQLGKWKIDARFNRAELIARICRIGELRGDIKVTNLDARHLLGSLRSSSRRFVYLDPPYVGAGRSLYLNSFKETDHAALRDRVTGLNCKWAVSYDDVPLVRALYSAHRSRVISLLYTARRPKRGNERIFYSRNCAVPHVSIVRGR